MTHRFAEFVTLIIFGLGGNHAAALAPNPSPLPSIIKPMSAISTTLPPLDTHLQPVYVPPPPPPPPTCVTGVTLNNYYANLVMQRESGGNSCATNPSGACGLFQALPCSKMGCSLYDVACQENWGLSYIASAYGSAANAWAHELAFNWY